VCCLPHFVNIGQWLAVNPDTDMCCSANSGQVMYRGTFVNTGCLTEVPSTVDYQVRIGNCWDQTVPSAFSTTTRELTATVTQSTPYKIGCNVLPGQTPSAWATFNLGGRYWEQKLGDGVQTTIACK
jgi:hypothetical protein